MAEAEDALTALARDLVREAIDGALQLAHSAVPEVAKPHHPASPEAQLGLQPVPPPRIGAGAVHPHLGHHLVRPHGDTISSHAFAHVPQPFEVPQPDAKDLKLAEQQAELEKHQKDLEKAGDYQSASGELEKHAADLEQHGVPLPGLYRHMTPEEHDTRQRYASDAVASALKNGKSTDVQHTLDGAGHVWTGDRAAMHRDLVHEALDQAVKVPSGRRAVLAGGLHHPGKDRVIKGHAELPADQFLHVDPQLITNRLAELGLVPEVKGLSPGESSALVHQEATWIAQLLLRAAVKRGKNVMVHTPMSDPGVLAGHADRLKAAGYDVHGLFVHTPVDRAVDAAHAAYRTGIAKYQQQKGLGSPPPMPGALAAADRGDSTANRDAFHSAKPKLDSWEHWDNTDGSPHRTESSGPPAGGSIASAEEFRKARK